MVASIYRKSFAALVLIVLLALSVHGATDDHTSAPQEEATDQGNAVSGPGGDLAGEEGIDENTTAGDPGVEGEEIPDWSKPGSGTLIFIVMVIALVPFSIVFVNVLGAYHYYGKRQDILEKLLAKNGSTSQDENQSLIKEFISMEPIGVGGVARAAMAIGVIVIVGVAVVFLLVNASEGDKDIVKEILLILSGALSSVIGFYFGGRTGQEGASAPPGSQTTEKAPETGGRPGTAGTSGTE